MTNFVDTLRGNCEKLFFLQKYHEKYLFTAVKTRNIHKIKKILESGVNADCKHDGFTLLSYAILHLKYIQDLEIIKLLLKYGADANVICNLSTPLTSAINDLNETLVELLLTYGANINFKDGKGSTAMSYIANIIILMNDNERIFSNSVGKILNHMLEFGADINNYIIIVYLAIERNDEVFLRLLLDYGADINLNCDREFTLLKYSIKIESDMCTDILLLHIIELRQSNKYIHPEDLKCLKTNKEKWEKLMFMKREFILPEKSDVTLYDLLSKSLHETMMYLRNEDIKQALQTTDFIKKYPKYFDVLSYRVTKSIEKNKLLDDGYLILQPILDDVRVLPKECILEIMSYLNYSDMQCFLKEGK